MKMTSRIQLYIKENSISVDSVEKSTGVRKELLTGESDRPMSATEFLEVCAHLQVKPEELMEYE